MSDPLYRKSLRLHPDVTASLYSMPREAVEKAWEVMRGLEKDATPEESIRVEGHENVYEIMSNRYRIVYEILEKENAIRVARLHLAES